MRYIDADAVWQTLPDDLPFKASVKRVLMQAPTADVEEVRHGEWIEGKILDNCSICGEKGFPGWKYCPNCGAKMDGERR